MEKKEKRGNQQKPLLLYEIPIPIPMEEATRTDIAVSHIIIIIEEKNNELPTAFPSRRYV